MKHYITYAIFGLMVIGLSGCGVPYMKRVDTQYGDLKAKTDTQVAQVNKSVKGGGVDSLVINMQGAYFGDKSVPAEDTPTLPAAFSENVTMMFPDRVNIASIGERITRVTGVPVRIMPDVFIRASALTRGGGMTPGMAQNQQPPGQGAMVPAGVNGLTGQTSFSSEYDTSMTLNYSGSLSGLLDLVAARSGISWEYRDGAIYLFRFETKTFTLKALPGTSDIVTSVGKDNSSSTGVSGGSMSGGSTTTNTGTFTATSQSGTKISMSVWDGVLKEIKVMLTPMGEVAGNPASGSITVTDIKEVVDRVGKLVQHENREVTRQVLIKVTVLTVTQTDGADYGINWNAVYNKIGNLSQGWNLSYQSPASLVSNQVGGIGLNILAANPATPTRFSGTSLLFQALKDFGRVAETEDVGLMTTNNAPVPFAVTNTTGYLCQTMPVAAVFGGVGGVPGLQQCSVTVGFIMNILPTILDNMSVLMQVSLDISTLNGLATASSAGQTIQTPNTSGNQVVQRVTLQPNQTLVLNMFQHTRGQYDKRELVEGSGVGLGGSMSGSGTKETTIVLLTPVIKQGA